MSLGKLLDEIRDYYLQRFRAAIEERRQAGAQVVTEEALRRADGEVATDGALALPMRTDLVAFTADGAAPESLLIDTEKMLGFEPVTFTWEGGLAVRVEPFQWNWCTLELEGDGIATDPLRAWFMRWFDRPPVDGTWQEVVHFMSDPKTRGTGAAVSVDFGSAPVDAFEELLDAVRDTGAKRVRLHAATEIEG